MAKRSGRYVSGTRVEMLLESHKVSGVDAEFVQAQLTALYVLQLISDTEYVKLSSITERNAYD